MKHKPGGWRVGYKILCTLDGDLKSYLRVENSNHERFMTYSPGVVNLPPAGYGPMAVFFSIEDIENWYCWYNRSTNVKKDELVVYKVWYKPDCKSTGLHRIERGVMVKMHPDLPYGTRLAQKVWLVKKVEGV